MNPQPTAYESAAPPLSYLATKAKVILVAIKIFVNPVWLSFRLFKVLIFGHLTTQKPVRNKQSSILQPGNFSTIFTPKMSSLKISTTSKIHYSGTVEYGIISLCPDGSGAAETCEPCQVREEAAVRRSLWVPPGCLSGYLLQFRYPRTPKGFPCSGFVF